MSFWLQAWPQLGLLASLLGICTAQGEEYVKVINGRCEEQERALPLGEVGGNWSEGMDEAARTWCDAQPWCVGYMRYIGEDSRHCHAWCGRPQFCQGPSLQEDENWASYVHAGVLVSSSGLQEEEQEGENLQGAEVQVEEELKIGQVQVQCPWPYEGSLTLWSEGFPQDETQMQVQRKLVKDTDRCQVLHHGLGRPLPPLHGEDENYPAFQGVLSEDEGAIHHFTANAAQEPWLYSFDSNEYIGGKAEGEAGIDHFGPKLHFLSLYFFSPQSRCEGGGDTTWGPEEAEEMMPGHAFVDDGTKDLRKDAFRPYHFTVLCGSPSEAGYVPQAVVDALGFATHPLVPKRIYHYLHRIFFHLPDAVQGFSRIHPAAIEKYVKKMFNDPDQNDAMYYKQSFLFLLQELFRYKYRQSFSQRLGFAACGLCDERRRLQRIAAGSVGSDSATAPGAGVGIAVCVMSRRSGHVLRAAIRETWATQVAGVAALRFFVGSGAGEEQLNTATLDGAAGDVVELAVPESYSAVTLKAFAMLEWAYRAFPNLRYLVRADDDVYLRTGPLFAQLQRRPPIMYLWGNFDHGSTIVRDPEHPHYNSYEQIPRRNHPLFGDIFPPYARGHLWAMSSDLLAKVVDVWQGSVASEPSVSLSLARRLPHPDDPALGVVLANLVDLEELTLNIDDRDLNHFALNPSCNATYLGMHSRTWVVHHVSAEAMRCMWAVDGTAEVEEGSLADLCPCSMEVKEEVNEGPGEEPFDYPRERFHE